MDITVNQETYSVSDVCSLQQILNPLFPQPITGIAVAVNQEIIAKHHWASHFLNPGDHITIIKATQGG
ncbi:sulfur carrier protein ThiS [Mucilaginibacter paludis]|uniref:Thiamine biosynthesis protein ThiS n=1 Tax=Mucilaginibacter paludis DSM 18603 TaxID=714943 RepID=H1Y607_9SPHI|nr:sulfur carrier protein ThiS [Mucilaginibacter paludis]EHQ30966.1 thiamine biosynthesis protein ThiS [Mucilaginibacter paludis DSM 18603]